MNASFMRVGKGDQGWPARVPRPGLEGVFDLVARETGVGARVRGWGNNSRRSKLTAAARTIRNQQATHTRYGHEGASWA